MKHAIIDCLSAVVDPCSAATARPLNILEMGLLKAVLVNGSEVRVSLRLTSPSCGMGWYFLQEIDRRLRDLPGVGEVRVELDTGLEWTPAAMAPHVRAKRARLFGDGAAGSDPQGARGLSR